VRVYNSDGLTACIVVVRYDVEYDYALLLAALNDIEADQLAAGDVTTAIENALFMHPLNKIYTDSSGRLMLRNAK